MKIGKTLGILALGAAITLGALNVPGVAQEFVAHTPDQPTAEMVIEQQDAFTPQYEIQDSTYYNEIHQPGIDAVQQETNNSGLVTMAPTQIAEHLDQPSVEGGYDSDIESAYFSAQFSSSQSSASFEVVCSDQGMGDALLDGHGPITSLDNGVTLQRVGEDHISSNWMQMDAQGQSHCLVASSGMSMNQTANMANSLHTFTPQNIGGAYLAQ